MLTYKEVQELPVSTKHPTNSYHDKVEVGRAELQYIIQRESSYEQSLKNCLKFAEQMQEVLFLTKEDAQHMAQIASSVVAEVYRAFSYPVLSCTGKTEKGESFYKAKVVIKFDTSG